MLGDFTLSSFKENEFSETATLMFGMCQLLGMIILLNLLIAIMGDTFDRVKEMECVPRIPVSYLVDQESLHRGAGGR